MKRPVTTGRIGRIGRASARSFLYCLPFFLLLQLIGQPELDDRHPVVGARSLSTKIFKQEHPIKSGLSHVPQLSSAVGSRLFTPEFYLIYVRIGGQQDPVHTLLLSLHSGRSPPRSAAS